MSDVILILRANLGWLLLGFAANATAATYWVMQQASDDWHTGTGSSLLSLSSLGILVASWRLARSNQASSLGLSFGGQLAILITVNAASLIVVTVTIAICLTLFRPVALTPQSMLILPVAWWAPFGLLALGATYVRRSRT